MEEKRNEAMVERKKSGTLWRGNVCAKTQSGLRVLLQRFSSAGDKIRSVHTHTVIKANNQSCVDSLFIC